jgi:hypothetical protein
MLLKAYEVIIKSSHSHTHTQDGDKAKERLDTDLDSYFLKRGTSDLPPDADVDANEIAEVSEAPEVRKRKYVVCCV